MKTYCGKNQLRIVGKAWEVKAKLRQLSRSQLTLQEWLTRQ